MTAKLIWQSLELLRATSGKLSGPQDWQATGVSIDSRTLQPGDLFVALRGPSNDGHEYVDAAFKAGAVAAIISNPVPQAPETAPLILVEDTMLAFEDLGRAGRARTQANIIAVTGSVGKTGTKEMLRLMLSAAGDTYANEGSLNNHWGVPLSLARMPAEVRYGVFELGMNHAGELGPLAKQVQPHVALITNIEAVHLEFFSSIEAIAEAKAEIFQGLIAEGAVVLNRDNNQFTRLDDAAAEYNVRHILSFGREKMSDARLINCQSTEQGNEIEAEVMGHPLKYRLNAPGEHLALNSLGALLAAVSAGGDVDICAAALANYQPPKGRGVTRTIRIKDGEITLIDESYNASPPSVRAAIQVLARMKTNGRRIMVLGDMRELGETSPALHAALEKDLTDAKIDRVYCCGEMMAHLYEALSPAQRGFHAKDSTTLAPHVASELHNGDIVTVKGSNAMKMTAIIAAIEASKGIS